MPWAISQNGERVNLDTTNLQFCSQAVRETALSILSDPTVHNLTKDIIIRGLQLDCLDAARDAQFAFDMLESVRKSCMEENS